MKNPGTAAVLSFLIPGVGQIYNGKFLRAIFWLIITPGSGSAVAELWDGSAISSLHTRPIPMRKASRQDRLRVADTLERRGSQFRIVSQASIPSVFRREREQPSPKSEPFSH